MTALPWKVPSRTINSALLSGVQRSISSHQTQRIESCYWFIPVLQSHTICLIILTYGGWTRRREMTDGSQTTLRKKHVAPHSGITNIQQALWPGPRELLCACLCQFLWWLLMLLVPSVAVPRWASTRRVVCVTDWRWYASVDYRPTIYLGGVVAAWGHTHGVQPSYSTARFSRLVASFST